MKFDTIIIGGGLSGLVCGVRLQKAGKKCAIISSGQNAMHFSSGYFDFMDRTPDGEAVSTPMEAVDKLPESHPYRKIGKKEISGYLDEIKPFFAGCGITLNGDPHSNGYRITPTGNIKPTWLALEDFEVLENDSCDRWRKVLVANIEGFLDFNTAFVAEALESKGIECRIIAVRLEEMERLRKNPSEMRATNIARVLDRDEVAAKVASRIKESLKKEDAVILPAVFGLKNAKAKEQLASVGTEVFFIATMPPSVPGIRTQMRLRSEFEATGGVFLQGDTVCCPEITGNHVLGIGTVNFGDIRLSADNYVLATGSFFSKGLSSSPEKIYETVFGTDIASPAERKDWYDTDFFNRQDYLSAGVDTDCDFRCRKDGRTIDNLYAVGSVLGGCNTLYEGSGAGTAIFSAFKVADTLLSTEA